MISAPSGLNWYISLQVIEVDIKDFSYYFIKGIMERNGHIVEKGGTKFKYFNISFSFTEKSFLNIIQCVYHI